MDGRVIPQSGHRLSAVGCPLYAKKGHPSNPLWVIGGHGLENAPIGVVTTPGTKNSKYVPAKPLPLPSSQSAMEHA
jgi:hypothetical protein